MNRLLNGTHRHTTKILRIQFQTIPIKRGVPVSHIPNFKYECVQIKYRKIFKKVIIRVVRLEVICLYTAYTS